jgi:XTP/dITP diphosphohydrolase
VKKLLVATHNRGKLTEYQEIFSDFGIELVTLDDVGIAEDVEETGTTFQENARLKAGYYASKSGLVTIADDSGLEVDALGGEPGVYSKRYAGEGKTDAQRNEYLLAKLREVPPEQRTARFRCVIAVAEPNGRVQFADGKVEGEIAFAPRGTNGFGYDPIFIVGGGQRHLAEFSSKEKNRISHRGDAAKKARPILKELIERGRIEPA